MYEKQQKLGGGGVCPGRTKGSTPINSRSNRIFQELEAIQSWKTSPPLPSITDFIALANRQPPKLPYSWGLVNNYVLKTPGMEF